MFKNDNYVINQMDQNDISVAISWAQNEGWNPGINDGENFFQADPNGFFITKSNGMPIATISAVSYEKSFSFIGFYIVKPDYRKKGHGIKIWNRALEHLQGKNIGLDGVLEQQKNYEKSGFKLAYKNARFELDGSNLQKNDLYINNVQKYNAALKSNSPNLIHLNSNLLVRDKLLSYDKKFFLYDRHNFLKAWIDSPTHHALGFISNGSLQGYGVIRKCFKGYKIGPLFADDTEIAETLFHALIFSALNSTPHKEEPVSAVKSLSKEGTTSVYESCSSDNFIYLDIPLPNNNALNLVKKLQMKSVFETVRMYTSTIPNLPLNNIFGITSFELG